MLHRLTLPESHIYCLRSVMVASLPSEIVWSLYRQDKLWGNWQPGLTTFYVEYPYPDAHVIYVSYRLPFVENRDSCLYR